MENIKVRQTEIEHNIKDIQLTNVTVPKVEPIAKPKEERQLYPNLQYALENDVYMTWYVPCHYNLIYNYCSQYVLLRDNLCNNMFNRSQHSTEDVVIIMYCFHHFCTIQLTEHYNIYAHTFAS